MSFIRLNYSYNFGLLFFELQPCLVYIIVLISVGLGFITLVVRFMLLLFAKNVILLDGGRTGGNAVLLYASRYNDVQTIVNIAGRFDLKRGIEGRLGKDFLEKIKQYGFIDVRNRRGRSVLSVSAYIL